MRILVADDSNFMRGQVIRMLKTKFPQAEIDDAPDGAVAVEKFVQGSYDLVLLDLLMPKISGDGALKRIREINQDVLVAILSADVQKMTREELMLSGADLFLNKPISFEKIDQIISLMQERGIKFEEA